MENIAPVKNRFELEEDWANGIGLSKNQQKFMREAAENDLEVTAYSGRFMYGSYCPSVRVDRYSSPGFKAKIQKDSLGLGQVWYAQY